MINEMIRDARKSQNRSQKEFSKTIGMSRARYNRFEQGEAPVSMNELSDMLGRLGLELVVKKPDDLLDKLQELIRSYV